MKRIHFPAILIFLMIITLFTSVSAQDNVAWLGDFTGDVVDGSNTLNYSFQTVDGNECKLNITEKKTDKKGSVSETSRVFYLSDLDPSAMSFKPSGKVIRVSLKIKNGQKFITESANGEFSGYTDEIPFTMSEVDKARALIDVMKSHSGTCKQSDRTWNSGDEAFAWLSENIGASGNSGTSYEQVFGKGVKPYLASLQTESTDSKGTQNKVIRTFDLSDINPAGISLVVSGKSLKVNVPVTDRNYFIMEKNDQGISFARDLEIYTDDIEIARNIVNALHYLASNTKSVRTQWTGDTQALGFVKEHLGEINSGGKIYAQSLVFDGSSAGPVTFTSTVTDSKGTSVEETSLFYLDDIQIPVGLNVTSRAAYLEIGTKDKNKYIRASSGGNMEPWTNSIKINIDDIDLARDLAAALEYAVNNHKVADDGLTSTDKVIAWLTQNVAPVDVDGKKVGQELKIIPSAENRFEFQVTTSDNSGTDVHEQFILYPEDLSSEDNGIKVSGKKLYVPLSTGKLNYIKAYKEGIIQNYTKSADVYFDDVQKAKMFTRAIGFMIKNPVVENRMMKDDKAAWDFLSAHITKVEVDGQVYGQNIEKPDDSNPCKVKFNLNETDSKGTTTDYAWEFILSDIDPSASGIDIASKEIHVSLITKNKQKLIKPYKNGEAQNFDDDVIIRTDDILEAKKILGAIRTLAGNCKK